MAKENIFISFPILYDYEQIYWEKKITTLDMMNPVKIKKKKMNSRNYLNMVKNGLKRILEIGFGF